MSPSKNTATTAPELRVPYWIDAQGRERGPLTWADLGSGYKLLYCFQHACPGCHAAGFPAIAALQQAVSAHGAEVGFAVVQTAFEDLENNTRERLRENQARYGLEVPFGHDDGGGALPTLIEDFATGGTPWFVVVDPAGRVVHSDFSIDVDRALEILIGGTPTTPTIDPDAPLRWHVIRHWARTENLTPPRRVEKTDAEWRAELTSEQFDVARQHGTERRNSSDMCGLFEPGRYGCVCCGTMLFDATTKFESRSGWPSFTEPVEPGVVAYHADDGHGMQRIEVTCGVCDAHLGHVFPDGPEPTGLRFCVNGVVLKKLSASRES